MIDHIQLKLADGSRVQIAQQGAQVIGWQTAGGVEQLYLSPSTAQDGRAAIRGGVPVCFPQFNQRVLSDVPCPKHGFARDLPWKLESKESMSRQAQATWTLSDSEQTRAHWPYAFEAGLQVRLAPGQLSIKFAVTNTDNRPWSFAVALHSYFRVDDIARATLTGLHQQRYWDAVEHPEDMQVTGMQSERDLHVVGNVDRVYAAPTTTLSLHRGGAIRQRLQISQSKSLPEVVVWNPGPDLCARLNDMPADGYQHMLCVEAARVNQPVTLVPGAHWSGWQAFKLSAL